MASKRLGSEQSALHLRHKTSVDLEASVLEVGATGRIDHHFSSLSADLWSVSVALTSSDPSLRLGPSRQVRLTRECHVPGKLRRFLWSERAETRPAATPVMNIRDSSLGNRDGVVSITAEARSGLSGEAVAFRPEIALAVPLCDDPVADP